MTTIIRLVVRMFASNCRRSRMLSEVRLRINPDPHDKLKEKNRVSCRLLFFDGV